MQFNICIPMTLILIAFSILLYVLSVRQILLRTSETLTNNLREAQDIYLAQKARHASIQVESFVAQVKIATTKDSELVLTALEPETAFPGSHTGPIDWSNVETYQMHEVDPQYVEYDPVLESLATNSTATYQEFGSNSSYLQSLKQIFTGLTDTWQYRKGMVLGLSSDVNARQIFINAMDPQSESSFLDIRYPGNDSLLSKQMATKEGQDIFKETTAANSSQ